MSDERYTFEQARIRLEEIATLARKKDTSLEKSLDLLEEGVRLANICTELVDHTDLSATAVIEDIETPSEGAPEGHVPTDSDTGHNAEVAGAEGTAHGEEGAEAGEGDDTGR
ncbi:MAG: exodeoxyribonuclease VII small subunit [Coriobacteriia bacterium]